MTVSELRKAADRVQGREEHKGRFGGLILIGIVIGILFNPFTGSATRKWLSDRLFGGGDDFTYEGGGGNGAGQQLGTPHRLGGGLLRSRKQQPAFSFPRRRLKRTSQRGRVQTARRRDVRALQEHSTGLRRVRGVRGRPADDRVEADVL